MSFPGDPTQVSLKEAKDWLRQRVADGDHCPCCNQYAKIYKRRLYSSMAACLLVLYRLAGDGRWVHKKELTKHPTLGGSFGGGDFAKLSYWGLVEERPKDEDADKKTSGWWRISDRGIQFAQDRIQMSEYVVLYDGRALRFEGKAISLKECLGDKFSYSALMNA